MFKHIALLAFFATVALAQSPTHDCANGLEQPDFVLFNDCQEEPCQLPQGSIAYMNVTITAPRPLEVIHAEVIATALGVETPYPLPQSDVCANIVDAFCPLEEGEHATYVATLEILDIFPQIPVQLAFSFYEGEGGEGLFCFQVNAEVV